MLVYFGTFLEFFEFVLFATLFPVLSKAFAKTFTSNELATLQYFLFWVGFLARPFGALVLSPIGDLYNRRSILIISVVGMAFTTMLMGCIPIFVSPYIVISCIVVFRLLQGFFTGVEYSSATIFLFEQAKDPLKKKMSVVYMGAMAVLGTALAYFVAALCQLEMLSAIHFWRAIFLLTGFSGLWIGGLRLTRLPQNFSNIHHKTNASIKKDDSKNIFKSALQGFFIVGMSYGPYYYITTFLNVYGVVLGTDDAFYGFLLNSFVCLLYCIVIFVITKRFQQKLLNEKYIPYYFLFFLSALIPFSYIIFNASNIAIVVFSQLILIILSQLIVSNIIGIVPSFFEENIRVRSYTLVQTLSASILGGTAPFICHMLAMNFQNKTFAAFYPMSISVFAYLCYRARTHKKN